MSFKMSRKQYAQMYGPTTGDSIRLADTDLSFKLRKTIQPMVKKLCLVVEK